MNSFVLYSVILPVYNEEENIAPLSEEIFSVMDSMGESYEVIFVEDGSTDRSARILENISSSRDEVRIIRFRKNFGQDIGGRPLLIFGTLFFIGGIQLFSLGLLAGLQYKLHIESKEGTSYSILEIMEGGNYDKEAD